MKKAGAILFSFLLLFSACPSVDAAAYQIAIEPQYNMAEAFFGPVAKVSKNSKWALINQDGTPITEFLWDSLGSTEHSYIPAEKDGKWGYINQSGKTVIDYQFAAAGAFSDGIALVYTTEGKQGYINQDGTFLFYSPFDFSYASSGGAVCGVVDDLYGYSDTEGHFIISPQFEMAYDFHEGYAAVKANGKWGLLTSYGTFAVAPAYDHCSDVKSGYVVCRVDGKYGIIDTNGKRISPVSFDYIGTPDEAGRYPAKSGEVSGYISANGTWLLKTPYEFCYSFTDGIARVYANEKWGYIDEKGNEIVAPVFADCGEYRNKRAPFSQDGTLWGYLSLDTTPAPVVTPAPIVPQPPIFSNEITDVAATGEPLPLTPDGTRCISMKIGSKIALCNDKAYALSAAPALLNGTTMIPARDVVELLGGTVSWNAENQRINMTRKFRTISMTIDSKIAFMDGTPTSLAHKPVLLNGSTMVPLRSVTDGWDFSLKWFHNEQNIYIYY